MPPSNTNYTVKVSEEEIPSTNTFNLFGSIFLAEGRTEGDCKNILRLSWNKSRETTGAICDKKVPIKLKVKANIYAISSDTHRLEFLKLHHFKLEII